MPALALGAGVEAGRPEGRLPQPPRHETMVAWTVCESGGGGRGRVGQREAEGFQRDSADNLATAPPATTACSPTPFGFWLLTTPSGTSSP